MAALKALESIKDDDLIHLYTDSTYLQKGITDWILNWKKNNWMTSSRKPVLNKDLWIKIDDFNNKFEIKWTWVKAHQSTDTEDSYFNNMADELATGAITK